jgi:hypothetical protein
MSITWANAPFVRGERSAVGDTLTLADDQIRQIAAYVDSLQAFAEELTVGIPAPNLNWYLPQTYLAAPQSPTIPTFESYARIDFDIDGLAMPLVPQIIRGSLNAPDLYSGAAPDTASLPSPPTAPSVGSVPTVTEPTDIPLPAVPQLLTLQTIPFSGVTIPVLAAEAPTLTLVEPTIAPYTVGAMYSSALLTALQTSLQARITTGGTGLAADVEQAIWDRAREREAKTLQDALDDLDRMEALGYAFPTGVYLDARLKIRTEYGKVEAGLSRDIAIKQAELELENVKQALTLSVQLEGQLMDYLTTYERQMFDAAKYLTDAALQLYTTKVQGYAAQVEAYRAEIAAYSETLRAELAKVEVYKAQLDAERVKADINQSLVAVYKAQVDAASYNIERYKARIAAAQLTTEMERNRVALYGEEVRAYAARANLFTLQIEGYKAGLQADQNRVEKFRAEIDASRADIEAQVKAAEMYVEERKILIQQQSNYIAILKARSDAQLASAQTDVEQAKVQAIFYTAEQEARGKFAEVTVKRDQAIIDVAAQQAQVAIQFSKIQSEIQTTIRSLSMDASKVGAQVAAQIAAAALNSVNWSNSVSVSGNESQSYSESFSTSTSTTTVISG